MERRFFAALWRDLDSSGSAQRRLIRQRALARQKTLLGEFAHPAADRASDYHRTLASLVLGTYETLLAEGLSRSDSLKALQRGVVEPNSAIVRWSMKAMLFFSRDPMRRVVEYSHNNVPASYGEGFTFEESGDARQEYTMTVTRCFYHHYFTAHSAAELTELFCAWDRNWVDAISPDRHGVEFIRSTTIAQGGDSCPFTFRRRTLEKRR